MIEKIIAGIMTGANLLFLIGLFISLKYWNKDWMKKLRKLADGTLVLDKFMEGLKK